MKVSVKAYSMTPAQAALASLLFLKTIQTEEFCGPAYLRLG